MHQTKTWVDMQIMYENITTIGLDRAIYKRYCSTWSHSYIVHACRRLIDLSLIAGTVTTSRLTFDGS